MIENIHKLVRRPQNEAPANERALCAMIANCRPEATSKRCVQQNFFKIDTTWPPHFIPESKQWIEKEQPPWKRAKVIPSAGKVMATVFWNAKGIISIDYLAKGEQKVCFHQDNLLTPVTKIQTLTTSALSARFGSVRI